MTLRTKRETVTFAHSFTVPGVDGAYPAGAYAVQTDEEAVEGLSFVAYRRVATVIFLPMPHRGAGSFQAVPIDPHLIEAGRVKATPASNDR